jgi:nitroreductase
MVAIEKNLNYSTVVEFPVMDEIQNRRSKRAYDLKLIEQEKINSLFEAARWAPSSLNEQPWFYIYATKEQPELYNKLLEALNESNRIWAKEAPLLVLSLARRTHSRNGLMNASSRYDVGAANAFLSLQATHLGLNVHQIGGYDRQKAISNLNITEDYEPIIIMAIGYPGEPDSLPEHLRQREMKQRERVVQENFVRNISF